MLGMDENAIERAQGYEFLAGIFLKEPSPEGLKVLILWSEAETKEESLKLEKILQEFPTNDPELLKLKQEYYDLFFVPVSGRYIPPYESAIRGAVRLKKGKMKYGSHWGIPAQQLSDLYENTGFNPKALDIFEPLKETQLPDHLGLELSFMAYLCRLEDKFINKGEEIRGLRNLQKSILKDHLLEWLPQFTTELLNVEVSGYYSYFALLALELCREEFKSLSTTIERSGICD